MNPNGDSTRARATAALLLLVPVASIGTYLGMYQPFGPAGMPAFALCKVWFLLLPAVWVWRVDRQKLTVPRWRTEGMAAALATGAAMFAIIAAAYWFVGRPLIDVYAMRARAAGVRLDIPMNFIAGALYWCLINSLLEEYVWRWFVFTRLKALMPAAAAVVAAGLLFTVHHVVALSAYFDWRVTTLGSLGVFIGGCTWSWLYMRYGNIWSAYVSHVLADAAIFIIGYVLLFTPLEA